MNIEITETKTYSFKVGDTLLEGFVIASEWNGMTELQRGTEKVIVYGLVSGKRDGLGAFGKMFGDIFGMPRKAGEPSGFQIISASPSIIALMGERGVPGAAVKP